eukprot:CAMPEP_0197442856 /NCGR_PEP_ID=MMETSP1175-20131217/8773_1 /TAXON_ID=1003142 /ORGANISM="Triceratium dubium, Strain CCMP147" /LENGTH=441 /DNA_ID=CAMNT_0042973409 /DNA_START=54 /DNA_END=1379 /DNA_ORIENTATION=-
MAPKDTDAIMNERDSTRVVAHQRRFGGRRAPWRARVMEEEQPSREDLQAEIRLRDDVIAAFRSGRRADREALDCARDELEELRRTYEADKRLHSKRYETQRMENEGLREEIKVLTRNLNSEAVIARYSEVMKAMGSSSSPEYASRLQSDLCKAAHQVEVLTDQIKTVKRTCDEKVKNLEEDMANLMHEKSEREGNLMKKLRAHHDARILSVDSYEKDLRRKEAIIVDLKEKLDTALDQATNENAFASTDSSLAWNSFKQQIDALSREKESVQLEMQQKIRSRDDQIALLQEVNAANEKQLELLRSESEHETREREEVNATDDKQPEPHQPENETEINILEEGNDQRRSITLTDNDRPTTDLLVLMDSLTKFSGALEGDIRASLNRKRRLIDSLKNDEDDSQISSLPSLPEEVQWESSKNLNRGMRGLAHEPSMMSVVSDIA